MIIAIIGELKYKKNPMKHTVYYAEHCERLQFGSIDRVGKSGTFKAVIAEDLDEAHRKLSTELKAYLEACCWDKVNPADFVFNICYSEVKDGYFWLIPGTFPCRDYQILEGD